ncbi:MAG: c-type cytochrome [Acidobacteriota bacterium]
MSKSILLLLGGALVLAPLAIAGRAPQQNETAPPAAAPTPQAAPAPAPAPGGIPADTKNPVKPTAAGMAKAKGLYAIDCAMCHADNGNGKTDLATSMAITPADFTDAKMINAISDGEMFNIIRVGKGKMPGEDPARAKDEEVWNLVTYVRSFSNPAVAVPVPEKAAAHSTHKQTR